MKKQECSILIPGGDRHLCSLHGWVTTKEELKHAERINKDLQEKAAEQQRLYDSLKKFQDKSPLGEVRLKEEKSKAQSLKIRSKKAREYLTELKSTVMKNGKYFHNMEVKWDG